MGFQLQALQLQPTWLFHVKAFHVHAICGIDIVLLNDSIPEIDLSDSARTLQQISARRILYANPVLDITEALLARMNAENAG